MTIANVMLAERSAVLFSDTALCNEKAEPIGRVSKVRVVPHLNAAFIMRGATVIARDFHEALSGNLRLSGFDDACDRLPEILEGIHKDRLEIGEELGHDPSLYRIQCFLVGFSPRRDRMRFLSCDSDNGLKAIEHTPGTYLEPAPADNVTIPKTITLDQAIKVADAQRRMMRANADQTGGGIGIGGELIAVELTPTGMKMQQVHKWADDEVRNADAG